MSPFLLEWRTKEELEEISNTAKDLVEGLQKEFVEGIVTDAIPTLHLNNEEVQVMHPQCGNHDLNEIISSIAWENLTAQMPKMSDEQIQSYVQRSLIFENLQDPKNKNSPFGHPEPFIWLYTSYDFYAFMNPLLRIGKYPSKRLPYASKETNQSLANKDPKIIAQIVKEVLFLSLMTANSLNSLPNPKKFDKVIRMAQIPNETASQFKIGGVIWDRGFFSGSGPGGGFAGGVLLTMTNVPG